MMLPYPSSTDSDMKHAYANNDGVMSIPGFPTEGRSLPIKHPMIVRRVSAEDRDKLRAYSIDNGQASWLQSKLFKKEVSWPRELYVKVLGCKGLASHTAPDTYHAPDGSTTTTASNSTNASVTVTHVNVVAAASATASAAVSPCRTRCGTGDVTFNGTSENASGVTEPLPEVPTEVGEVQSREQEQKHEREQETTKLSSEDSVLGISGRAEMLFERSCSDGVVGVNRPYGEAREDRQAESNGTKSGTRERAMTDTEDTEEEEDEDEDEGFGFGAEALHCGADRELEWLVRVMNTTTGNDLYTKSAKGGVDPSFGEAFVVPCQGPRDAVVLSVYGGVDLGGAICDGSGEVDERFLVGEAVIPLDARFVVGNHAVLFKLADSQGRTRGFVRVEAFWVDEAKPRKETGEFYYRVAHPRGVNLRELPCVESPKELHVMRPGEVFMACERQQHAGDGNDDGTVFIRVSASTDRWTRGGWCFETLTDEHGQREVVLERVSSPKRERGNFMFRVCAPQGVRLHSRPDVNSGFRKDVILPGSVLEASEIWTPAGSSVSFVSVDVDRGYILFKCGEKVIRSDSGQLALESIECPEGVLVSSQGTGDDVPPPPPVPLPATSQPMRVTFSSFSSSVDGEVDGTNGASSTSLEAVEPTLLEFSSTKPSSVSSGTSSVDEGEHSNAITINTTAPPPAALAAVEAAAVVRAVRQRLYRVRAPGGVPATTSPDIASVTAARIKGGEPFYGMAEVVKRYEGVGEVAFIKRAADGLWVRANRPGMPLLLDLITDRVEAGAFTYRVSHENGVVVRTAPGLEAPILKPRRILPVKKLINVCERLERAEDIISLSRPPTFLRLAGNDGWVFDRRGHTLVCEDVTEKARIATANAITAEAARLARSRSRTGADL